MTKAEREQKQQAHDRWVHDRAYAQGKADERIEADRAGAQKLLQAKVDLAHQLNGMIESTARAVITIVGSLDKR